MPFGLTKLFPCKSIRQMNEVIIPFIDSFAIVYMDVILIYNKTREEYFIHLRTVLENLREKK